MKSKIRGKIIVLIVAQLFCMLAFTACLNVSPLTRIKNRYNLEIKLLKSYKIEYDIQGETFTGRAPCYTVIKLKEEPTDFLNSFQKPKEDHSGDTVDEKQEPYPFSSEKNPELKNLIDSHINCCLTIPNEFYPDWNDDYLWIIPTFTSGGTMANGLCIIYFPNELELVFYETGY